MVNVAGEKMSKSLGNFTTIADVLDEHDPRALRVLVLQTHYRKTMEINAAAMAQAKEGLDRLDALVRRAGGETADARDQAAVGAFIDAMDDDLGTPRALATVFDLVRRANAAHDAGDPDAGALTATALELAAVLGVEAGIDAESDPEIDALVARRQEARSSKDFATADAIRDELQARGIEVEDTPNGPIWRRT